MKPGNQFRGFQFDERTNIGASDNSQGTLFQVKRGRDQAGPKGFSPERQDEVRKMLTLDPEEAQYAPSDSSISVRSLPGRPVELEPSGRVSRVGHGQILANQRLIQDMVSRSTIPDLHAEQRTRIIVHSKDEPIKTTGGFGSSSVVGQYHEPKYGQPHTIRIVDRSVTSDEGRLGGSPTLIHELGHRDSWIKKSDSSAYDNPTRQGTEEAYADDFAATHTRGFGDRKMPWLRPYPTPPDLGFNQGQQWRNAYDRNRTTPTEKPQPVYPKDEQLTLLHKVTESKPGEEHIAPPVGQAKFGWAYKDERGMPTKKAPR